MTLLDIHEDLIPQTTTARSATVMGNGAVNRPPPPPAASLVGRNDVYSNQASAMVTATVLGDTQNELGGTRQEKNE